MTITVKLETALEARLRERAACTGRSTSDVIRAALSSYLDATGGEAPLSAFSLGEDLFGRHAGSVDLAQQRKAAWAEDLTARQAGRGR